MTIIPDAAESMIGLLGSKEGARMNQSADLACKRIEDEAGELEVELATTETIAEPTRTALNGGRSYVAGMRRAAEILRLTLRGEEWRQAG
jgi:hypothetical protein